MLHAVTSHPLKSVNSTDTSLPLIPPWRLLSRAFAVGIVAVAIAVPVPWVSPAIAATSTAIAQAPIRPTLRIGSTGSAVSEVQAMLVLLGYFTNPVDGQYQASTEAAVKKFQQDVGLNSDGIVGPATWSKLLPTPSTDFNPPEVAATPNTSEPTSRSQPDTVIDLPTLRKGMNGPAVSRIQEALKAKGFYTGPIDGAFGPMTEAAVMSFQREAGLAADGVVGPATWRALLR